MLSNSEICWMKILVVAATKLEIVPFLKMNTAAEVLTCGVGIPASVYHLTKKLLREKYDIVIQAGIAGSFSKKIKKGEVVIVEKDVFGDIGVEEKKIFKSLFQIGLQQENEFPFTKGWLINSCEIIQRFTHLKHVKAITVNKIVTRKKYTNQLKKCFNADIETMEGAAFHFVCLEQNVPFLQIRSISNKVGERDKSKWKIKIAVENLNKELIKIVDLINK